MTLEQDRLITALYRAYVSPMRQYAYRHCGSRELADDLTHQAFLIACSKCDEFCSHPNPVGYLFLTLSRLTMRENSRFRRQNELSDENMDLYAAADRPRSVEELLPEDLRPDDREILLLKYRDGLTHQEIAERLGITVDASKQKLSRALKKCRIFASDGVTF